MKLSIIGVGDDGLNAVTAAARDRIVSAEKLLGDERALSLLGEAAKGERVPIGGDLEAVATQIEKLGDTPAAMVVFGDPMFYGLARFLTDRFGKDRFVVLPHVSSMQLAFARVMESWDEAYLTDVSQHPLASIVDRIRTSQKVGLFTTDRVGPNQIAQSLLDRGIDYFTAYVCENLGARDERVTRGELPEIAADAFGPLNVMILIRKPDAPDRPRESVGRRLFGNPDDAFLQAKPKQGLLTPAEVRSLALAQLDIAPGSIVWDVGAGSGSVSVEAAQLAVDGAVYAIEMDPEDHDLIQRNAERFGATNVLPILGKAPDAWNTLPDPDCVFIAGAGREVINLATAAYGRLRSGGRLVVNMIAIDNLGAVRAALIETANSGEVSLNVWMVNIARGADQLERLTFEAVKPNFLLAAVKS
ncbi:MAG: precorrin-6y C5,15-methyltransferase (decarboxylating) subunit CbiE [Planctomycetota bacterium]